MEKKYKCSHTDVVRYVHNRMDREEETLFQLHLVECEECRESLYKMRRIMERVSEKEKASHPKRFWMVAAVVCLIAGGTAWFYLADGTGDGGVPHQPDTFPQKHYNSADTLGRDTLSTDSFRIEIDEVMD